MTTFHSSKLRTSGSLRFSKWIIIEIPIFRKVTFLTYYSKRERRFFLKFNMTGERGVRAGSGVRAGVGGEVGGGEGEEGGGGEDESSIYLDDIKEIHY